MQIWRGALVFVLLFAAAHAFKFMRFYLVLLEEKGLTFPSVFFLYARTTFANLVIPFKLGEFYRIGAVSRMTRSLRTGLACVAVDRFFDTAALLAMILPFEIMAAGKVSLLPGFLFCLLILLFLAYISFPPSYRYLNRYLILHKKSERAMTALRVLDYLRDWYRYAEKLITGRSPLILLSSFLGWGAEFLALKAFAGAAGAFFGIPEFNDYIRSIFRTGDSPIAVPYHFTACILIGILTCIAAGAAFLRTRAARKGK